MSLTLHFTFKLQSLDNDRLIIHNIMFVPMKFNGDVFFAILAICMEWTRNTMVMIGVK